MWIPSLPNLHSRFLANLADIVRSWAKKRGGSTIVDELPNRSLCTTHKSGLRFGKVGKYNGKTTLEDFSTSQEISRAFTRAAISPGQVWAAYTGVSLEEKHREDSSSVFSVLLRRRMHLCALRRRMHLQPQGDFSKPIFE